MIKTLNPGLVSVNPNAKAFLQLTDINQEKVLIIYMVACLLKDLLSKQITVDEFDTMYDQPLDELRVFYMEFHEQCLRTKHMRERIEEE
jgi:hypothetical protein